MSKIIQALPATTRIPIGTTDVVIPLKYLKDTRGNYITAMPAGATILYGVLEPESSTKCEIISFTGIQNDGNNQVTLTGVTRNLNPQPPYTALTPNVSHGNNIEFILSNTPPFYNTFVQSDSPTTISAIWTFLTANRPVLSADADTSNLNALVTFGQLTRVALGSIFVAGKTVVGTAGEAVTANDVVYQSTADGKWYLAKADNIANLDNRILGIAKSSASANASISSGVQLDGYVSGLSGLSVGLVYPTNLAKISNTAGTNVFPIGVAISTTEIIFDIATLKRLSYIEKIGIANAYPMKLSSNNPALGKDILYTDGVSVTQATDIVDVAFGQNDATTKRLKLAQSFLPTKSSLASLIVKKGATVTTPTTDSTMTVPTFASFATGGTTYTDGGVISLKRLITGSIGNHTGDYYELTRTITGNIGDTHTGSVQVDRNNMAPTSTWNIYLDGVSIATGTAISNGTTTMNYSFPATATSHSLKFRITSTVNTGSPWTDNWYNFTDTVSDLTGLITATIYSDNAGSPSASALGSATITGAVWTALANNAEATFSFATPVTGLDTTGLTSYWLVLTYANPSATLYPTVRKAGSDVYAGGVPKYNNTTDGWVTEGGDLYFKAFQSPKGVLLTTDTTTGKLPLGFMPDITTLLPTTAVTTATRAGQTASGSQTIAHGLGKVPKVVKITSQWKGSVSNFAGEYANATSSGVWDGTNNRCVWATGIATNGQVASNSTNTTILHLQDNGNGGFTGNQTAVVSSVDATNITLTWTLSGTMSTNDPINMLVESIG